jgi:poly-gamma-glutamate synthesis protein (capsule biosynthesis protein)
MQALRDTSRATLRIGAFLATCVVLLVVGIWATVPADNSERKDPTGTSKQVRMTFVGDIMLDRDPGKAMLAGRDPFEGVADLLKDADLTVGNLECVVADSGTRLKKSYTFRADPQAIPYLARYFHALSLANNHTGDFGDAALIETMYRLRREKIPFFGAGLNEAEAHTPWIVEKNGIKLALLGYNEFPPRSFEAGRRKPGLAWSVDEQVVADIKAVRPKVDLVITFMHWGEEYIPKPNERQKTLAQKMIDAGADVVVGNHPHVTQGHDLYKGRLVVYCLGNFVFDEWKDEPEIMKEERRLGWVLRMTFTKSGLVEWNTVVTRTDDNGFPEKVRGAKGPGGKIAPPGAEPKPK